MNNYSSDFIKPSPYDPVVPDRTECDRCGKDIRPDGALEYRHRYILNDQAESHQGDRFGKLCCHCWQTVVSVIEEGSNER